jgi:hypothetical protein
LISHFVPSPLPFCRYSITKEPPSPRPPPHRLLGPFQPVIGLAKMV